MKAVVYNQFSKSSEVLAFAELPTPNPTSNQVLIKNKACGMNPKDVAFRKGYMKFITGKNPFPLQTGYDVSGVVEKVGTAVTDFQEGDEVFGYVEGIKGGAASEYLVIPQKHIAHKPEWLTFEMAASMPCAYLTALQALRDSAKLQEGERLLIYGASGGVGTAAIQLAKVMGAHITTISSTKNVAYCLEQGADEALSYEEVNIFDTSLNFDVFLQVYLKGNLYAKSLKHLNKKGRFLSLAPGPKEQFLTLRTKLLFQKRFYAIVVRARQKDLAYLAELAQKDLIKPQIAEVLPVQEIRQAHDKVGTLHTRGKIVVSVEH